LTGDQTHPATVMDKYALATVINKN